MTSNGERQFTLAQSDIDFLLQNKMCPIWSVLDAFEFCSIKHAIHKAKVKKYLGVGRYHIRRPVRDKLLKLGYKIYYNKGFWVIHWS